MARRLYVGNLPYSATNDDLRELFDPHGKVVEAVVIIDKPTGKSKGFGFVEMETDAGAAAALKSVNGATIKNRELKVNYAKERDQYDGGRSARRANG